MVRSGTYLFRRRSYLPLLFLPVVVLVLENFSYLGESETIDHLWELFCVAVAASGLSLRALTVGYVPSHTSGRNTKQQKAHTLNTTGMYSIVSHPLYLGNFLIWLGVALFAHTWWFVLIVILAFWIYYERIMFAEEEFLRTRFGAEFEGGPGEPPPSFLPSATGYHQPSPFPGNPCWLGKTRPCSRRS